MKFAPSWAFLVSLSLLQMNVGDILGEWMRLSGAHLLFLLVDGFILVKLGFDLAIFLFGKENMHSSFLFHDIVGLKNLGGV
jgi:hypothetical protein